jgi:hypothetical protein
MDVCTACERTFDMALETAPNADLRGLAGRIRETLQRYQFELRTELHRIGDAAAERPDPPSTTAGLRDVLDTYDSVLDHPLPPHPRAMVKRQYLQVQELSSELDRLSRAA